MPPACCGMCNDARLEQLSVLSYVHDEARRFRHYAVVKASDIHSAKDAKLNWPYAVWRLICAQDITLTVKEETAAVAAAAVAGPRTRMKKGE